MRGRRGGEGGGPEKRVRKVGSTQKKSLSAKLLTDIMSPATWWLDGFASIPVTSSYEVISSSPCIIAIFARLSSLYTLISTKFNLRMHLEFRGCSCSCVVH
jgi:hypothetical protein